MKNTGIITVEGMRPRARTAADAIELHYRAEFANALLSKDLPPPPPRNKHVPKAPDGTKPVVARLMEYVGEGNRKHRRALLKHLLNAPVGGRPLTAREQTQLEKLAKSDGKTPMSARSQLPEHLSEIFAPGGDLDMKKPADILRWQHGLLREVAPGVMPYDDGREDDAEPGDPTDDVDDPAGDTIFPGELLINTQRITCVEDTNEWGWDEIDYSGIAFDAPLMPTGIPAQDAAALMRTFDAGQFTQGTTKDFSDRDPMHSFDMTRITTPHIFFAVFSVAEIDPSGGFRGYLNRLLLDLDAEMRGFWAIVLGTAAGTTALYAGVGALMGPPVILVMAIMGFVIGLVAGLILAYGLDDVFPPSIQFLEWQPDAINLPPFDGNLSSENLSLTVSDFGGEYRLDYNWELVLANPGDQDSDQPL